MKRALFALFLFTLCHLGAFADISVGKAYKIQCVQGQNYLTSNGINSNPSAASESVDVLAQCWCLVDAGNGQYKLRDMSTGYYLQSSSSRSGQWALTSDDSEELAFFSITSYDDGAYFTIYASSESESTMAMHRDSGNNIVCWGDAANNTNSRWIFTQTEHTDSDIADNFSALESMQSAAANVATYQAALLDLFSDNACTSLKVGSDFESSESYQSLPTVLQNMVRKVNDGSWAETFTAANGETITWDGDYANKYRVQLYEPYNEPECAASALGINAHTNLNNPTGIFADKYDVLYVMVDGTIKGGASLYLASYTGHGRPGGYADGIQLSEGLNVIPVYADGSNFVINYVVETFDTTNGTGGNAKNPQNALSNYQPLKIHIEGGKINGYWNKVGDELYTPDKNSDWEYIEQRATQTDVTILGRYMTLQFPLNDADTEGNSGMAHYLNDIADIENVIDAWDSIMLRERLLMGLCDEATVNATAIISPYSDKSIWEYTGNDALFAGDYSDYYNVHGLAFGVGGDSFMYGGWDHSGYHFNTMSSIISSLPDNAREQWGPAHEIGHQHQGPINMRGLTEVTNNLFSNVILWCFGKTTSRVNGADGALDSVLDNINNTEADFFNLNIWAQTHLYYKLFLYYHVLGHNTKFYPRLFEMLRQDPMVIQYNQDGAECLLHFYKKCCEAAEEDLTEMFRAHGFFRVMTDRLVGDYTDAVYNMTQAQIDAAINEVKQLGYKENMAVLFINDGTGEQILSHRDDTEYLTLYDEGASADLGSYATFNTVESPSYTCSVTGSAVTMNGSGGIGFAIYNANGEIVAFSNKKTFEISTECIRLIMSGQAKLVSFDAEGNQTVVEVDVNARYALLGDLIAKAQSIVNLADETGTKVGFYKQQNIAALADAYANAKKAYAEKDESSFGAVYTALEREYSAFDGTDRIGLIQGNAYRFTSKAYPERSMTVGDNNTMSALATDDSSDAQKWYLEASAIEGSYYLKNKGSETYPGNVSTGAVLSATASSVNEAYAYKLQDMGNGLWAFVGNTALHCSSSQSYNIVGWGSNADASQWYITAVEIDAEAEARSNLAVLIQQTEALVSEMIVSDFPVSSGRYNLQVTDADENGYLSCSNLYNPNNATTNGDDVDYNCAQLLDGNIATYIHTDYSAAQETYPHYLKIDFGDAVPTSFKFTYTTRHNGANQVPKKIVVKGSNDDSDYSAELAVFTSVDESNPLPVATGTSWTSADFISGNYRYLRFEVQESAQGIVKPYFVMSEFGIICNVPLREPYAADCTDEYLAAIAECENAKSTSDPQTAYSALKEKYDALLSARNAVDASALTAQKAELQALIDEVKTLIETCAEVTYSAAQPDFDAPLQTGEPAADYYIWTNAQSTQEGPIAGLIDGNPTTYFHSDYSGANSSDGLDHHITVNLGEANALSKFKFSFTNRSDAEAHFPTEIVVYGSNDGSDFTDVVATFSDISQTAAEVYDSPVIDAAEEYAYLRFMVTKNSNNTVKGGHQFFHMAEFAIHLFGSAAQISVVLTDDCGNATEQQVLAAYLETREAASVITYGTTAEQVQTAYNELNAAYLTLKAAQTFDKSALKALIDELSSLLDSCSDSWLNAVDKDYYSERIEAARVAYDDKAITAEEYQDKLDEFTAVKMQLAEDVAFGPLPVKLTTDLSAPVYHVFVINRWDDAVLRKGGITQNAAWPQDHKIRVIGRAVPADEQLWYFTKGETAPNVYIRNKAVASDSVMSVIEGDLAEGLGKVGFYMADGSNGQLVCDQWLISDENSAFGFYNVRAASNTAFYFSNYGGDTNNMGFYNEDTDIDSGSNFKFEPKSDTWMTLYDFFSNEAKVTLAAPDYIFPEELIHSTANDCYASELAAAYESAYREAHQLILSSEASDDDIYSAYTAVRDANESLVPNTGGTVGIVEITADSLAPDAVIYDLQGRRISHPRRLGIYIINGQKSLLK